MFSVPASFSQHRSHTHMNVTGLKVLNMTVPKDDEPDELKSRLVAALKPQRIDRTTAAGTKRIDVSLVLKGGRKHVTIEFTLFNVPARASDKEVQRLVDHEVQDILDHQIQDTVREWGVNKVKFTWAEHTIPV